MSAKKKKQEEARAATPEKSPVPPAAPQAPVEAVRDPKVASISVAEYKRVLQSAKHPASLALAALVKQFSGEQPPFRGENGKAAWLVPGAAQSTQTISEVKMTVEGQAMTFSVHADTHVWAIIDLIQCLEKGETLTLASKGKGDDQAPKKLGLMRSGKPELVKNLQFYAK